jgi:hypothetical protein
MSKIVARYAAWCRRHGAQMNCAPAPMAIGVCIIVVGVLAIAFRQLLIDIALTIGGITALTAVVILAMGGHRHGVWRWCGRHLGRAFTACGVGRSGLRTSVVDQSTVPDGYLVIGQHLDGSPAVARGWTSWRESTDRRLDRDLADLHARQARLAGQVGALAAAAEADPLAVIELPPDTDYAHVIEPASSGPGKSADLPQRVRDKSRWGTDEALLAQAESVVIGKP